MNLDELAAAGLYDPTAPDAEERRALLELALDAGAEVDEIRVAIDEKWLHAVPIQRAILGSSPRITVDEAARRAGLDHAVGARIWSALGLDGYECTADDVAVFTAYAYSVAVWGEVETLHLARTTAAALAALADAEVALSRAAIEAPLRASGGDYLAIGRVYRDFGEEVLPRLHAAVTRVHAHHLSAAGRRYAVGGSPAAEESTVDVCVGFADLVGYTEMGNRLDAGELDGMLRTFEARAHDAAAGTGRRLVKLIGDEAMFVAGTAADAIAIATALLDDPALGPMRVGIASGRVVVRAGDVFGAPVNLAARLVAIASPGEVVLDAATAGALDEDAVAAKGTQDLPGFPEPVHAFSLSRSGG